MESGAQKRIVRNQRWCMTCFNSLETTAIAIVGMRVVSTRREGDRSFFYFYVNVEEFFFIPKKMKNKIEMQK